MSVRPRGAELARTFPMLGDDADATFEAWFDEPRPPHAAIVAFIESPREAAGATQPLENFLLEVDRSVQAGSSGHSETKGCQPITEIETYNFGDP